MAELPFASEVERDLAKKLIEVEGYLKASRVRMRNYSKVVQALDVVAIDLPDETVDEFLGLAYGYITRKISGESVNIEDWKGERKKLRAALRAYNWDPDAITKHAQPI